MGNDYVIHDDGDRVEVCSVGSLVRITSEVTGEVFVSKDVLAELITALTMIDKGVVCLQR